MVYIFLADGFEEIEALTPYDMLKRADIEVKTVSVSGAFSVTGSHGIEVIADEMIENIDEKNFEMLILPGGMPGTINLEKNKKLCKMLQYAFENNMNIGAICAAPKIIGEMGFLNGKKATCYPGFENFLIAADVKNDCVVTDNNIITAKGMGNAIEFSSAIITKLKSFECAENVLNSIQYK